MPLAAEANAPVPGIAVEVSAVVDLYVFLSGCERKDGRPSEELVDAPALAQRIARFWQDGPDGYGAFDELPVLAALGGFLAGGEETLAQFVATLPEIAARTPAPLRLRTEQEETRERLERHLQVLREDAKQRARYVALIADAAAARRPRWVAALSTLQARAGWLRSRLGEGEDLHSLLPARHIALLPRYWGLVDEALRRETALVVPTLESDLVYDLPGVMLIGLRLQAEAPVEEARRRTVKVAERLRALGDPTRLAIAAYLSTNPASVSSLAKAFDLSQPTVSAHVRSLRTAELLDAQRSRGMTEFRLSEGRLTGLFKDAHEALFGSQQGGR
ncbi:MAG: winged helix-turn-helix transcriptional regulator [Candidatus Dormibacteraeota bacterium]|nr:winged helix-turn-helix transcriptional regulator [Candidatus Dormibacteraeota bacterium]